MLWPGDEVITPACGGPRASTESLRGTFSTCVAPLEQLGLTPVFVDVVPNRYVPTVDMVLAAVTPKTKRLGASLGPINSSEVYLYPEPGRLEDRLGRARVPSDFGREAKAAYLEICAQVEKKNTSGCLALRGHLKKVSPGFCAQDSCDTITYTLESDVSVISFYVRASTLRAHEVRSEASHIITAGGLGGMVMFNDEALKKRLAARLNDPRAW